MWPQYCYFSVKFTVVFSSLKSWKQICVLTETHVTPNKAGSWIHFTKIGLELPLTESYNPEQVLQ